MKKIINGRVYESEKAKQVGVTWESTQDAGDPGRYTEALYRKRNGEHFLHVLGGPESPYRRAVGPKQWTGLEDIRPLSAEEARMWAEEHMAPEAYADAFGAIVDDDSQTQISMRLNAALVERLRREASISEMNLSRYVETLLLRGLES